MNDDGSNSVMTTSFPNFQASLEAAVLPVLALDGMALEKLYFNSKKGWMKLAWCLTLLQLLSSSLNVDILPGGAIPFIYQLQQSFPYLKVTSKKRKSQREQPNDDMRGTSEKFPWTLQRIKHL